jgi:hypothetical protein
MWISMEEPVWTHVLTTKITYSRLDVAAFLIILTSRPLLIAVLAIVILGILA